MNYALINKMSVRPGKRDEVIEILLKSGAAFDDNPHCLLYLVSKDKQDENVIWIQDVWTDEPSHEIAMKNETMQQYIKQAMPLLTGMPEQIAVDSAGGKSPWN